MDIEGAEFDVISGILDEGLDIRQICIEIHTRFVVDGKEKEKKIIKQLRGKGYRLVYVSEKMKSLHLLNPTNYA